MTADRRSFIRHGALGLLAFHVGGVALLMEPSDARAQEVPLRVLTAAEQRAIEALGETLLPGAAVAGLAHYLDQQLAAASPDSLLMIRYLDVPPPYVEFYRPGIAALDQWARRQHGKVFADLTADQRVAFVEAMQKSSPEGWQAAPAPFFYFVVRSDAVDVVYGTAAGFAKLGVPYMAHITPATDW